MGHPCARCAALAALLAAAGCGYSFTAGKARMPAGAERVYVVPFANKTGDAEVGAQVTAALREELARRGCAGGDGAPARLEGAVVRSQFAPTTPEASSYRLTLEVQVRLVVDDKVVAEQTARRLEDYLGEVDALASEGRRRVALHLAATGLARDVVERFETP
ncbi:MAG TPA: LptE family protein [Anaeromyxobacteraceae bacterium]|nr:LptE family protein [Anaeromyxobacteraceae bacterium]